jgi:hypothetical protein
MCQLGAVVFSANRVFRKDRMRSHSGQLLPEACKRWPEETFYCAEFDFATCEWGMANGKLAEIPDWAKPMLDKFAHEEWGVRFGRGDAEKLMRFVEHAGPPESHYLLKYAAQCAYTKAEVEARYACTLALNEAWLIHKAGLTQDAIKAEDEARRTYRKAITDAWLGLFANSDNRIEVWQERV